MAIILVWNYHFQDFTALNQFKYMRQTKAHAPDLKVKVSKVKKFSGRQRIQNIHSELKRPPDGQVVPPGQSLVATMSIRAP